MSFHEHREPLQYLQTMFSCATMISWLVSHQKHGKVWSIQKSMAAISSAANRRCQTSSSAQSMTGMTGSLHTFQSKKALEAICWIHKIPVMVNIRKCLECSVFVFFAFGPCRTQLATIARLSLGGWMGGGTRWKIDIECPGSVLQAR